MKRKIITLIICSILLIYFIGGIFYNFVKKDNKDIVENKIGNTIKNYKYVLYENELDIYIEEFNKLKKILENKEINYEEYAISISKLFLIDLYTLDNKKNKYDIGGTEFIYPNSVDNYKLNVENTLYKFIIDNSNNDREQELPVVKDVKLETIEETKFTINDKEYDAYKLNLTIEYEKDLEYDNEAEIIVIKDDNYLHIVEKN